MSSPISRYRIVRRPRKLDRVNAPRSLRWRFFARTAGYLLFVVGACLNPMIDLPGAWKVAVAVAGIAAAVGVCVRLRRPWLLPLVSILALPVVGRGFVDVGLVSVFVRRRDRRAFGYLALAVLGTLVPTLGETGVFRITLSGEAVTGVRVETGEQLVGNIVGNALITSVAVLGASLIRTRRELVDSLRQRAERAESERAARAREAVLLERTRIAREMHDVLGHKISLLTMQAGALEMNPDAGSDVVAREAERIRETARQALADLRSVIGTLEATEHEAPLHPREGITDVPALVTRYREAGAQVEFTDTLNGHPQLGSMTPEVSRAVHRVLTEALTNAHVHAPGRPVEVSLTGEPGRGIDLVVENDTGGSTGEHANAGHINSGHASDAQAPGTSGTGLPGLAERVRLVDGTLTAGQVSRHGSSRFRVHATMPWGSQTARASLPHHPTEEVDG